MISAAADCASGWFASRRRVPFCRVRVSNMAGGYSTTGSSTLERPCGSSSAVARSAMPAASRPASRRATACSCSRTTARSASTRARGQADQLHARPDRGARGGRRDPRDAPLERRVADDPRRVDLRRPQHGARGRGAARARGPRAAAARAARAPAGGDRGRARRRRARAAHRCRARSISGAATSGAASCSSRSSASRRWPRPSSRSCVTASRRCAIPCAARCARSSPRPSSRPRPARSPRREAVELVRIDVQALFELADAELTLFS